MATKMMDNRKYKILLVEDDRLDQMAFKRLVKDKELPYDCTIAGSVSEVQSILGSERFDIVISDYSLGDGTAFDILGLVKDTPTILVTGAGDEEIALKAWRAGAYDYLINDFERNYLKALAITVENAIERKKMKETLDRKQKNLEAIFDAVPVGMLLVDENMIVKRVNDAIRQLVRREYLQIINQSIGGALGCINSTHNEKGCGYSPACAACPLRKTIKSVLDSEECIHELEIQPTLKVDDKEITPWLRISAEPAIVDGCKHVVVAVDDITDRKKAEEKLRDSEERLRNAQRIAHLGSWDWNIMTNDLYWSEEIFRIFGFSPQEFSPTYDEFLNSVHPDDREFVQKHINAAVHNNKEYSIDHRIVLPSGELKYVHEQGEVNRDKDGTPYRMVGTVIDITDIKRAEEKLKETMELKSQFISTVSHELQTPLTNMKEGIGIVLDEVAGEINDEQRNFLDIAKRNVDRLARLINGVLDFQKLEAGRMKFNMQENDVTKVVEDAYHTVLTFAKKRGVELSLELEGNLPRAIFDSDKIIQVLTNLISNAIKFTPEKGQVTVCVQHQSEDLVIRVSDTGMGIPKEALPKVFDRFYRVHRPGKQIQGTGLGLAIVKRIVMMHGGRIEVESEMDQGTSFTVFLPLAAKSMPEVPSEKMDELLEKTVVNNSAHTK